MNRIVRTICIISLCWIAVAWAETFVVKNIQINGLQRIKRSTVMHYLPVTVGRSWDTQQSAQVIRALYDTQFFSSVSLDRKGNTLLVNVVERPVIADVNLLGADEIPREKQQELLTQLGLQEGRVFRPEKLDRIQRVITVEYQRQGKFNVQVRTRVKELPQRRMSVTIMVESGVITKVRKITLEGNKAFSNRKLISKMPLAKMSLFTLMNHKHYYSQQKMMTALDALRQFYRDQGYLDFKILNHQVNISEDRQRAEITIKMQEGKQYTLRGFKLTGKFVVPKDVLRKQVTVKAGDAFKRDALEKTINALGVAIGDEGYAFAQVRLVPEIDSKTHTVLANFVIVPGQRVYVRHINFSGNYKTTDIVLRRAVRQEEGAMISIRKVKESQRQLRILSYIQDAQVKTHPVLGKPNQVDLEFQVVETPSAEATFAVGYGTEGVVFDVSLNQANFLGSGRSVGLMFKTDERATQYKFNYYNPYYRPEGIGRGFNIFYQKVDPGKLDISNYTSDQFGGNITYNYPLSDVHHLNFGAGYSDVKITSLGSDPSRQLQDFIDADGEHFQEIKLQAGWSHNTYDQYPYPTRGLHQTIGLTLYAPVTSDSLTFFKANYTGHWYYPLTQRFIMNARAKLGYGHGLFGTEDLPFYENYYAGGFKTVRGFKNFSLGPRDSKGDPLGGNLLTSGSVGLIFPNGLDPNKLRTELFVDAGNVYDVDGTRFKGINGGPLRFSAGLGIQWSSPLGPLEFYLARSLNEQSDDDTRFFDFTISVPF